MNQKYVCYCPNLSLQHSLDCTIPRSSIIKEVLSLEDICVVYYTFLWITVCVFVFCVGSAQGSMRKANSLSECRLLRVRRSGRRRRSLGKREVSSGRWRAIRDRRARIRPSCNCSTAHMSEMPERSEGHSGGQCEWLTDTVISSLTKDRVFFIK